MGDKNFQKRGLNFSVSKYKVLNNKTFVPHIRSNLETSIPLVILNNFSFNKDKNPVALIKIISDKNGFMRIKKLMKDGKSLTISLKNEKNIPNIKIEVLNIKDAHILQKRKIVPKGKKINVNSIIPSFTQHCSLPCKKLTKISPIYLFDHYQDTIAGIFMGRKDIRFKKEFRLDELACSAMGLYESEGGKINGSFTNSQPKMINIILEFIEKVSNVNRKNLTASINCNYEMASKKKNLEKFWKEQTGIEKFQNKLHLGKMNRQPQGVLQIYFGSQVLKEFMCGMLKLVFNNKNVDNIAILRGILSGDGSPILQTKSYITHHIATDKKHIEFQEKLIRKICAEKISNIKNKNNKKIILYNNWETNLEFLFSDPYRFNKFNRLKFVRQFLNLKATREFIKIKTGNIMKGKEIAHGKKSFIRPLINSNFITLKQIRPKPNKKYKIYLTKKGTKKQEEIKNFIQNIYPSYIKDVGNFKKKLKEFGLK